MRKILSLAALYLGLVTVLCAQNISYDVTLTGRYYSEPSCGDCSGGPDPVWNIQFQLNGGTYNWNSNIDDISSCSWQGGVGGQSATYVTGSLTSSSIVARINGYESDNFLCGGNDADCGGHQTVRTISNFCDYAPYQTHVLTDYRSCTSNSVTGTYGIRYSFYWRYEVKPTIIQQPKSDTTLCLGTPYTLTVQTGNDACGNNMGRFYQWQVNTATGCGTNSGWVNISGANSASLTVPQTAGTRIYRCLITSGATASFTGSLVATSNCARVTYNSLTPGPAIQSSICGNMVLPGTSHALSTLQPPTVGAIANLQGYAWTSSGGTFNFTTNPTATWTAPSTPGTYTIQVNYVDGCGNTQSPICTVNVGAPACDFVYMSPNGTDDANCGGPSNPCATLTGTNGALAKVSTTRNHIKMEIGNYYESNIIELQNNLIIEGRYVVNNGIWTKNSDANNSTEIECSGKESVSGVNVKHRMGIKSDSKNNWKLIDINLKTTDINEIDANNRGASNYAIWINNSTGYEISRCEIESGNASKGADGSGYQSNGGTGGSGAGNGGSGANGIGNPSGGSNGAAGGAGGTIAGLTTVGAAGGAGGVGVDNCGGSSGASSGGCSGSNGGNGGNGSAGASWAANNRPTSSLNSAAYFSPSAQAEAGAGGGGGGQGAGGAGSRGGRVLYVNCDGKNGGKGGAGGAGGGGGKGGFGGGGTFAIWQYQSTPLSYDQVILHSGSAGLGGNGANGQTGITAPNTGRTNGSCNSCANGAKCSGNGGYGGNGGNGGRGRDGANGLSAQLVTNGIASSLSLSIPNSPIVQIHMDNATICANSIINIETSNPTWSLPSGFHYVPYSRNDKPSQFTNSSLVADIYSTNTSGLYNLTANGTTFNNYLAVTKARPTLDIIVLSPNDLNLGANPIICDGGSLKLDAVHFQNEIEFKWEIFADSLAPAKGSVATPIFSSTLRNPITSALSPGEYLIRYQAREECCGWSVPTFKKIKVVNDPTAPTNFSLNVVDTICVPNNIIVSNPTGATNGITPYTFMYDYENANHSYGSPVANSLNVAAELGVNKVSVYIAEDYDRGCDATSSIEKSIIGIQASLDPTLISGSNSICPGETTTLFVNGGIIGFDGDAYWYTGSCGGTLVGTGQSIQVSPSSTTTYYVRYEDKCHTTSCLSITVTVNSHPSTIVPSISTSLPICFGGNAEISIANSQTGYYYQLLDGSTPVGSAVNGNGGNIRLLTPNLTNATNSFDIIATGAISACADTFSLSAAVTVSGPPTQLANNGDSRTCYINGNNDFVEFSVGNRGIASLNPGNQNLGDVTITEYVNGSPINVQACFTDPYLSPELNTAALNRHWVINSSIAPVSSSDIRLYINGTDVSDLALVANVNDNPNDDVAGISSLELSKYSGPNENDQWNDNCVGGNTTIHFQTGTGQADGSIVGGSGISNGLYVSFTIPSFSELWLSGTDNVSPLPIVLGNFDAECKNGKVNLTWNTISEVNNDKFIIERSENGLDYDELFIVHGAGNSNQPLNYMATDIKPIRGIGYYRLKQIDFNGKSEYFPSVTVTCFNQENNAVNVYPNPAQESFIIEFHSDRAHKNASIEMVDITGRTVGSKAFDITEGLNKFNYNPLPFNSGTYVIRIKTETGIIVQSPIVIHKQ